MRLEIMEGLEEAGVQGAIIEALQNAKRKICAFGNFTAGYLALHAHIYACS